MRQLVEAAKIGPTDPQFAHRVFHLVARAEMARLRERDDLLAEVVTHQYVGISHRLDKAGLQESCSYRSSRKARLLAELLVDEEGELIEAELDRAIALTEKTAYSLGPGRHVDGVRTSHQLRVLQWLKGDAELRRLFLGIGQPSSLAYADELIRETLHLESDVRLTAAHTRRAILAAHLTYLRQNVGSCFATAPASMIHRQQPKQFLRDIGELLATGKLTRILNGTEYSVPLSRSWGVGELMKPVFLARDAASLAQSPGLQAAFIAAELMEEQEDLRDRFEQCRAILEGVLHQSQETLLSSAGKIIRRALLSELKLTEEEIRDYESRPKGLLMAQGLLRAPPKTGGVGQRVEALKAREGRAVMAFKRLTDNALLKSWEFTLASFAESKSDFAKWNFYTSLGLPTDQPGGIGPCIYGVLQEKLDGLNREQEALRAKYDILHAAVKFAEGRAQRASERELQWLKLEYRRKVAELESIGNEINGLANRASLIASLPPKLVEYYLHLFPDYFQEVYDAEMQDVKASPFDDSPAGFRLLYKHGRTNPALWSFIHNPDEFVAFLTEFFTATERAVIDEVAGEALEREMMDMVTAVVTHVRSDAFLLSSLERMARAYGAELPSDPLADLSKVDKKPWSYVSGGAMTTLVASYYGREVDPTLAERIAESPTDLLVFLLDLFKDLPPKVMNAYLEDPTRTMLVQSPTHGFQLKPGRRPFADGWLDRGNAYTWVRDCIVIPQRDAYHEIQLGAAQMQHLLSFLEAKLPFALQYAFRQAFRPLPRDRMGVQSFRQHVVDVLRYQRWFQRVAGMLAVEEELDGILFAKLPLVEGRALRETLERIFLELSEPLCPVGEILSAFDLCAGRYSGQELVAADQLQEIAQALALLVSRELALPHSLPARLRSAMRHLRLAMPEPVILADTNWVTDLFAFLVNPGTDELELWRVEEHGFMGYPMARWRQYLSPQNSKPWCVYSQPFEYESRL